MNTNVIRLAALVPGVVVVFLVVALACSLAADELGIWAEPFVGFITSMAVVATAFALAPGPPWIKLLLALLALILGTASAWQLLRPPSFTPESWGNRAYQPTYIPIAVTVTGGVVAWLFCAVLAITRVRLPNPPMQRTARFAARR